MSLYVVGVAWLSLFWMFSSVVVIGLALKKADLQKILVLPVFSPICKLICETRIHDTGQDFLGCCS